MMTEINEFWPQNELERVNEIEKENRINYTVSIIINNYNYERFLKGAIDSALHQTYQNTEIIVVDDGSTDNSAEIIREYAETKKIIPILKKNGGQISACNAGFLQSHGEIVLFLDSDDVLLEDAVESIVRVWDPSTACIQGTLELVDEELKSSGGTVPFTKKHWWVTPSGIKDLTQDSIKAGYFFPVTTSALYLSRVFLENVMPLPEEKTLFCDYLIGGLAPLYGKVKILDKPLALYRQHDSNHHNDKGRQVRYSVQMVRMKEHLIRLVEKNRKIKLGRVLSYYDYRSLLLLSLIYPDDVNVNENKLKLTWNALVSLYNHSYLNLKHKLLQLAAIFILNLPFPIVKRYFKKILLRLRVSPADLQ